MSSRKLKSLNYSAGTLRDKELADQAKEKAGGVERLAKLFGVTKGAASRWGRVAPIPRHLRPRIEEFIGGGNERDLRVQQDPPRYDSAELRRLMRDVRQILESGNRAAIAMLSSAIKACRHAARSRPADQDGD
jgi:hypothetical protein